jgi:hypothetical protein
MIFGINQQGRKAALTTISPAQVRKQPIEQLGVMLKTALVKAEDENATALYVYVPIGSLLDEQ